MNACGKLSIQLGQYTEPGTTMFMRWMNAGAYLRDICRSDGSRKKILLKG
jgi:hypothetical protein